LSKILTGFPDRQKGIMLDDLQDSPVDCVH
jgi:hypothetical protein